MIGAHWIAQALGGQRAQRLADGSYLIPCPVPSHGKGRGDRHPSLRIGDGETRVLLHCFGGCDPRDVLEELRRRGLLDGPRPEHPRPAKKTATPDAYARGQHRKAARLWSQREPIAGSIAEIYVRSRGITCALPRTFGFLSPTKPEHHPAMIAAFAIPDEPEPGVIGEPRGVEAVHLTLLKPDGSGKADAPKPKLMVGSPGALPIVVAPPNDLLALAITEGIEDALTAHQATGLGAWAAGAAGRMPGLAGLIPSYIASYIECVTIFAHASDRAGRDGAQGLAEALDRRNRDGDLNVEILIEGLP
jgi:hypothetical protein